MQIAPYAIAEYEYWERHSAWNGQNLFEKTKSGRACRRNESGEIVWVSPGILFPILGAMGEFVVENGKKGWSISKPNIFKPAEMVSRAVQQFRGKSSDPYQMGRDAGVYDALRIYPHTLVEVMKDVQGQ